MSPVTKRKARSMSALPVPPPESKRRAPRKDGLRKIARLLEEQMDEMGLSEEEKNAKIVPQGCPKRNSHAVSKAHILCSSGRHG